MCLVSHSLPISNFRGDWGEVVGEVDWLVWRQIDRCFYTIVWGHQKMGLRAICSCQLAPSGTSPPGEACFLRTYQREFSCFWDLPPELCFSILRASNDVRDRLWRKQVKAKPSSHELLHVLSIDNSSPCLVSCMMSKSLNQVEAQPDCGPGSEIGTG